MPWVLPVQAALSYIVTHLEKISALASQTDRVDTLMSALVSEARRGATGNDGIVHRAAPRSSGEAGSRGQGPLLLEDLTVLTPGGREALARHLSLVVGPGQSVLIMGPSGCGKSSILRAISGEQGLRGRAAMNMPSTVAPDASCVLTVERAVPPITCRPVEQRQRCRAGARRRFLPAAEALHDPGQPAGATHLP